MSTLPEFIERIRKESPAAIGTLNDQAVTRLLRAAFRTIADDVANAPDGVYKVGGLGMFRVHTVEANAEGKGAGRRVMFKGQPPKAKTDKPAKAK